MNNALTTSTEKTASELGEVISEVLYLHAEMEALYQLVTQIRVEHQTAIQLLLVALGGLTPEEAESLVSQVFKEGG